MGEQIVTEFMEFNFYGEIRSMSGSLGAISRKMMLPNPKGGGVAKPHRVKVKGMPPNGDDLYLYKVFAPFGAVMSVSSSKAEDGTCTGVGFVKFMTKEDAHRAIENVNGKNPLDIEEIDLQAASNARAILEVTM